MPELVVTLKGIETDRVPIRRRRISIGRDPECEVQIDNLAVSRRHAVVELGEDNEFKVIDQDSNNGITVDGKEVSSHPLIDGASFHIGKHLVTFSEAGGMSLDVLRSQQLQTSMPVDVQETAELDRGARRRPEDIEDEDSVNWLPIALIAIAVAGAAFIFLR